MFLDLSQMKVNKLKKEINEKISLIKFRVKSKYLYGSYNILFKQITKSLIKYGVLSLVTAILLFYEPFTLEKLLKLSSKDLKVELIGALIIFLLIDIPLTVNREKKKWEETKKIQIVFDHFLHPISDSLFILFFHYLFLPSKIKVNQGYPIKEIQNNLLQMQDTLTIEKFYVNYKKEETRYLDPKEPVKRGRGLRKGFQIRKFESQGNVISLQNNSKDQKLTLSFKAIKSELEKIENKLKQFIDLYSKIMTANQVAILSKLLIYIREILYGLKFKIKPINRALRSNYQDGFNTIDIIRQLHNLHFHYLEMNRLIGEYYLGPSFGIDFPKGLKLILDKKDSKALNIKSLLG